MLVEPDVDAEGGCVRSPERRHFCLIAGMVEGMREVMDYQLAVQTGVGMGGLLVGKPFGQGSSGCDFEEQV